MQRPWRRCFGERISPAPSAQPAEAARRGAGGLLLSEEALSTGAEVLAAFLRGQPVWSDLPLIVLSRSGTESPTLAKVIKTLGNVSVLERPVRMSTLISLIASALRARQRQYEVRDYINQREQAEAERRTLLESEQAARAEAERGEPDEGRFSGNAESRTSHAT